MVSELNRWDSDSIRSADIEAITKQVNERLAELTEFGVNRGYSRIG